jgi:hypothetical protein
MPTASRSSSKATRAKARKSAVRKKAVQKSAARKSAKSAYATPAVTRTPKASGKSAVAKGRGAKVAAKGKAGSSQANQVARGKGAKKAVAQKVAQKKVAGRTVAGKRTAASSTAAKPATRAGKSVKGARANTAAKTSKPRRGPQLDSAASKAGRGGRGARVEAQAAEQLKFGFKDERSEVAVLQKQNRHLLLQIAKRRALITVSKQAVDELMRELSERVIPYREELFAITRELCDLRDRLLDSSGLPSPQLEKVRWALHQMLASLPIEEAEDAGSDEPVASDAPRTAATENRTRASTTNSGAAASDGAAEAAQQKAASGPGSDSANAVSAGNGAAEYEFAARTSVAAESAQREAPSAAKPTGDQSGALRTLFKKLAITYHPDRVQDEGIKAARTKIMKELTLAFEGGDLARLLELERTLAARASGQEIRETPELQAKKLTQSNVALRTQLRELDVELDRVKEDCPFTLDLRSRDPARVAHDELDQLVLDRHLEVERAAKTREFVASFAAGRMKVADFLKGPPHLRRFSDAQLAQMMR